MRKIKYFYSAHSAYAYLGSAALLEICVRHDCVLVHKPILLSPVVEAVGGLPFAARTQPHVDYFFGRELERWAELRGVPIINHRPTHHDNPLHLPNGVIIATPEALRDQMAHAILKAHWRDDADIADDGTLIALAERLGLDGAGLVRAALEPAVQAQLDAYTEEAIARSVFGSPCYFLDGEMFYGQDRLDILARALERPFAPARFTNPPVDPS
ncbi:2-hydroxychromene-2-carboxylate isomerase [Litoreibacter ponti]|uniref:2-hydroxychromene-2-carboxylate isomerase n=1 Tax=Litoreibacter ponti TaxID=1510457 RepID=A0A2T6BMJ0_9RHOB|nr:2-hydroxychromene-2-carboxylate isomerase [Litoreibacter ponti]PTX57207.1 2-hydroxychromene-2-carboxylate isomerase [Litoreibacter ponti]